MDVSFQDFGPPDFGLVIDIPMNYDTFINHWKEDSLFMRRILIVDHDIKILNAMSEAFRAADYEVLTADSGFSALEILEIADIDLVISDLRLPLMDGYELLSKVKELHAGVIRIIMSSYVEETFVFKAIVQNLARFYILKPYNSEKLLEYIGQIFETEEILRSNDLLLLINSVEKLPTIETSYQKILGMIERDMSTGQIAAEIEKDFAISSRLLQIANFRFLRTSDRFHQTRCSLSWAAKSEKPGLLYFNPEFFPHDFRARPAVRKGSLDSCAPDQQAPSIYLRRIYEKKAAGSRILRRTSS